MQQGYLLLVIVHQLPRKVKTIWQKRGKKDYKNYDSTTGGGGTCSHVPFQAEEIELLYGDAGSLCAFGRLVYQGVRVPAA